MVRFIILFLSLFILSCGYRPMAYYANKALGDSVYVKLKVNLENTEESVAIKDLVNEAIVSRFHSHLDNEENASSIVTVDVKDVRDSIVATNSQGFATFYRVIVSIDFSFKKKGKNHEFSNSGYFDYAASLNNPLATYQNRQNAILEAAKQSLDRFISQVGYAATF